MVLIPEEEEAKGQLCPRKMRELALKRARERGRKHDREQKAKQAQARKEVRERNAESTRPTTVAERSDFMEEINNRTQRIKHIRRKSGKV